MVWGLLAAAQHGSEVARSTVGAKLAGAWGTPPPQDASAAPAQGSGGTAASGWGG